MLKLKSSARESKRYLLLKASRKDVENAILDYIGILGYAKAAPVFVIPRRSNKFKGTILAVNTKEIENVKAAFGISAANIEILKISGTLKGLE